MRAVSTQQLSPIFQVHEFNQMVSMHLQRLGEITVEGEISQMQISQGKWLFMTIKDELASVSIFAPVFRLSGLNLLEEGMKVHVHGTPSLYQKSGRFSINASQIVPAGEGSLRLAYEKLKKQLEQEGLFDAARKRALPKFINAIGLITAKGSRAYSDFIKVLAERIGGIKIYFYPVQVQGKNSVDSLLEALAYFNQQDLGLDALVITRGGGSLEDLLSFNDEKVARAIFASKIPVISAIGHEDDIALTDLVADIRASTPSNAAELLMAERSKLELEIKRLQMRLEQSLALMVQDYQQKINQQINSLQHCFIDQRENIYQLQAQLDHYLSLFTERSRMKQEFSLDLKAKIIRAMDQLLADKNLKHQQLLRLLNSFDYQQTLERGYSIIRDFQGKIITDIKHLQLNQNLTTQLATGQILSTIKEIKDQS